MLPEKEEQAAEEEEEEDSGYGARQPCAALPGSLWATSQPHTFHANDNDFWRKLRTEFSMYLKLEH